MRLEAQKLKQVFATKAETLIHGDLHTGSIMVAGDSSKVIDPEFAFCGPAAFDVGVLIGDFWMSFFSQRGHEQGGSRDAMRRHLLKVVSKVWSCFREEFSRLWQDERTGMLFERRLFEDRGDARGAEQALHQVLHAMWEEMLGFAGVGIHRRILGLAHNADFELIEDRDLRAKCEARALYFGRHLLLDRGSIQSIDEANTLADSLDRN